MDGTGSEPEFAIEPANIEFLNQLEASIDALLPRAGRST